MERQTGCIFAAILSAVDVSCMLQDARPPRLRKGFNAEYGGDSAKWASLPMDGGSAWQTGVWHARDCRILWAEGLFVTGARGLGLAGARERRFGDSDSVRGRGKLISEYLAWAGWGGRTKASSRL